MLRFLNYRWWMLWLGLAVGVQSASAFSLLGPGESWQTPELGYERIAEERIPEGGSWTIWFTDFSTHPMNLGEEFRWNEPVLYYAYDSSFLDYFGSNGVAAVDAAVAILNSLTNVSSYSADLSEFPLREARVNSTASALHLFDLKSAALEILVERLGLADPEHWTWALRSRMQEPGASCPIFEYGVIQRNFDPVTLAPSRYVNGNLFTYFITQSCTPDYGDAEEFAVDPTDIYLSAVASPKISYPRNAYYGYFHTYLTRDDVGGLRYLYAATNVYWDSMSSDSTLFYTNISGGLQWLFTSNLTLFATQALTNNPVALQTLYPTLNIVSSTNIFTNIWVTNVTAYYTNSPMDPAGTAPYILKFATNRTLTVQNWYRYTFGNVVTFQIINGKWTVVPLPDITTHVQSQLITIQTTGVTNYPMDPVGTPPHTNTTSFTYATNEIAGEYYIVPTNQCGVAIAALQATLLTMDTNVMVSATNLPAGATNALSFTQVAIDYFTNHVFTYYPVDCVGTNATLHQGIEKVTFVRRDYDSLLGRYWYPITNYYTLTTITNYTASTQQIQRVVTQPDIVFSAADLTGSFPYIPTVSRSTPVYGTNGILSNVNGPGTIQGPMTFQFNKVGPIYLNGFYPLYIDEVGALFDFAWGSFDGTTNAPVVYPIGTSISALESQVLVQISPAYLPAGSVGNAYQTALQTVGPTATWTAPYTWSLAVGSAALPPGLGISSDGVISGNPTTAGLYEFVVQVADSAGRTARRSYSINFTGLP
jgi:hypothetical protein